VSAHSARPADRDPQTVKRLHLVGKSVSLRPRRYALGRLLEEGWEGENQNM